MARNVFQQRGTALEDEFFHQVDQQLIAQLEIRHQQQSAEQALSEATGILDPPVLAELRSAEITPRTLAALSLFPAVFVAWADGHVELAERSAILRAAHQQGIPHETAAGVLLGHWLLRRPTPALIAAWKDFIHAIRPTISGTAFRTMQKAALERAEQIARAAGGFLGFGSVSAAERVALAELNEVFEHVVGSTRSAEQQDP